MDDSYSACRYMGHGLRKMGGKQGDSKQIRSRDAFGRNSYCYTEEFVPLQDEMGRDLVCMENMQQSPFSPGEEGSPVPGVESFQDPDHDPQLAAVFKHVHYPYDSDKLQGQENLQTVQNIASYMKRNPRTFVFIEGHCDQRGAQAYNLALGARRANTVRSILVAEGVPAERLFTVSYGKEYPVDPAQNETAWAKNRRAQFKVYQR